MCSSRRCRCSCILIGPCRPKWMRVVDNFYAERSADTQSKLRYYCLRQPDKLDRIAKYIYKRLAHDLNRGNDQLTFLAIDAINMLLGAYQGHRLVLAQVFLRMVHLLLQTNRSDLQIRATSMFVEFSQIEDEVPNYSKEYNDLLDHFTSMSHASCPNNAKDRNKVRRAGICGIQGVVRKTVGGRLHLDVVHGLNMDKIIPSLLLNICEKPEFTPDDPQEDPSLEAVYVFKDITRRASYNNIEPVVSSILQHFDNHKLWIDSAFSLLIFQYLLDSIENTQVAHGLVKQLVAHLSLHESDFTLLERTCMVQVIGLTVITLAKGAIGPDVFHNFKALLQILRASIDKPNQSLESSPIDRVQSTTEERLFQDAIINTIAEFAKNLPDTQKIEILKFILNSEPMSRYHPISGSRPRPMIMVLLQTMLTVATQYKTVAISNALNSDFLNMLLRGVAIDPDPAIRIIVQKILHTLLDRHGNTDGLLHVQLYMDQPLNSYFVWEEPSRQDILFMKKTGVLFTENIYHQLLDQSNKVDCLEHLFCTFGLVALEMGAELVVSELFRLILAVQRKLTDEPSELPIPHQCAIHALLASAMSLLVQLIDLSDLLTHVREIIHVRQASASYLLPSFAFNRTNTADSYPSHLEIDPEWLFSLDRVSDVLANAGYDVSNLKCAYNPVYTSWYDSMNVDPLNRFSRQDTMESTETWLRPSIYDSQTARNKINKLFDIPDEDPNNVRLRDHPSNYDRPVYSSSSLSLTDSLYSTADSTTMGHDQSCFQNINRVITNGHDTRRNYPTREEEDRLLYQNIKIDFNSVFSPSYKSKTIPPRMQFAEILDDLSNEIQPYNLDPGHRKLFNLESGALESDSQQPPKSPQLFAQSKTKKKPNQIKPSWEREYISLFTD